MPETQVKRPRMMDLLQSAVRGELSPPPVAQLIGFQLLDVSEGRATIFLEAGVRHSNPMGRCTAEF